MPALVQNGIPIFTDIDGDPLEDGYIYIGEAGLNPLSNPLQAYWDADLTIPAGTLPTARTKGGAASNNGAPARLYVATNYSILVQDKKQRTVYSVLNSVDYYNSPSGNLVSQTDTLATLREITPVDANFRIDVNGHTDIGDVTTIPRYFWKPGSTATDNDGSVVRPNSIDPGDPGRFEWGDDIREVNPRWFGAKGDGATDDTDIIQYVFDNFDEIFLPGNVFAVTSVSVNTTFNFIYSYDSTFFGIANTPTDAILVFEDARETILRGRLNVVSDGSATTPVYQGNYKCAVHIKSDDLTSDNSQFMYLQGLRIANIKAGIVSGGFLGESFQPFIAQSEIWIEDYQCRGVLQPFYQNASNAYMTLSNCLLVGNQFEASGTWFVSADGWSVRNDVGVLNLVGCEIQRSLSDGYAIYGNNMFFTNGIHEYSCPNYFTGDVTLTDISNGFFGSGSQAWAEIPATYTTIDAGVPVVNNVTGRLQLNNAKVRRPDGTSGFSGANMIECTPNDYRIIIDNSELKEWAYNMNNAVVHFIKGGILKLNNSLVISDSGNLEFNAFKKDSLLLSCDGTDMITTQDQTDKSGWEVQGASPASGSWFAQSPDTYTVFGDTFNAIRILSVNPGSIRIATPLIPVGGVNNIMVDMLAKSISTGTGLLRIKIKNFDYAGNPLADNNIFDWTESRFAGQGYQDNLLPLRIFKKKNRDSSQIRIEFFLEEMTLDFTDFKVILN